MELRQHSFHFHSHAWIPPAFRCPTRHVIYPCRASVQRAREEFVLAIDVGTSGTKAALVSSTGRVASSSFASHPPPTPSSQGWQASVEQDPYCWWLATKSAIHKCVSNIKSTEQTFDLSLIQVFAITGQMQDIIFVPKNEHNLQRRAILYSDARATVEAEEVIHLTGGDDNLTHITGTKQGATSLLAKLRWLDKHDPGVFHECQGLLFGGHDYIVWKLSHVNVTDATTASTTGLTDTTFQYAEPLLQITNLDHWLDKLPPIKAADSPCGEVSREAAEELGYSDLAGVPILHCCGDNGSCTLGAGCGAFGSLYAYLGTSGWVAGSFPHAMLQTHNKSVPGVFTLAHPDQTLVFRTGSIMTAGGNLAWAATNIQSVSQTGTISWELVDQHAANSPSGSRGLLYLPFLNGERCPYEDPEAKAAFIGISASITPGDMYRAVMEGVCFALLSAMDAMTDSHEKGPLRVVGGGARSPIWPLILANVFGKTVEVLEDSQDIGVKGAALLAGKWLGWHSGFSVEGDWIKVGKVYVPSPQHVAKYQQLYEAYKTAYFGLHETFKLLSKTA